MPLYERLEGLILKQIPDAKIKVSKTQISFSNKRGFAFVSFNPCRRAKERPEVWMTVTFGLSQLMKRKHLKQVDFTILVLGGFYLLVMAAYVLFEMLVINYRPVLINGCLEVSYPSSTTMLVLCVMPTAIMQLNTRIKSKTLKRCATFGITAFIIFMVIGRLLSGVHWFTDIVGGALLSAGLVMLYHSVSSLEIK